MLRDLARRTVPRGVRLSLLHPAETVRWLAHALRARFTGAVDVDMGGGWVVRCHPAAVRPFTFERDADDLRDELAAFRVECCPGMVLYDIGAHFGLFTLAALHAGSVTACVVAVDPSRPALDVFDANVRLARAGDRVRRFCAAVGDQRGEAHLLTGGAGAWHMMTPSSAERGDTVAVERLTLDDLVARAGVAPTHVKIDVEGDEGGVIAGGAATLGAHRPIIFLELHGDIL